MGGGLLGEVVVGCRRIPHGEAVMVLGSDEQHSHAGVFGLLTPRGGIEVGSIEGLRGSEVLLAGNSRQGDATIPGLLVPPCLDLLGVADFLLLPLVPACVVRVDAPVDEHGELHVLPGGDFLDVRGRDCGGDCVCLVGSGVGDCSARHSQGDKTGQGCADHFSYVQHQVSVELMGMLRLLEALIG